MPKDIVPRNKEDKRHGYCRWYYPDGDFWGKGIYVHGSKYGYCEGYNSGAQEYRRGYWMNGNLISKHNKEAYCYIWERKEIILNAF